ncbi:methyltransferase family protein [Rhodococcus sp. SMB37]|uniref:class I SAM-dependent methyltransferase n=1 Tax=Rhodococcus sp. SMB37 TaxID=2512213 RepID=UPI0010CFA7A1|nr:class I SAM-dependent methyltransferase [Rhodococcus sp. SMB37]TCN43386.1 methyltransferase family protein [Rhodococcus sp. SMB37]
MSAHQPEFVEHAFNDRADTYRHSNWHRDYAERLVQIADVTAHTTVIDACTGTGMAARAIARLDPTIRVVGVDMSQKMLDRARHETVHQSLTNIRFVHGDATSLSDVITEGDVDLIVCSAGLLYLPITEALSNWSSVLSAGGRIAFSSMATGNPPAAELFRRLTADTGIMIDDPSAPLGTPGACREHIERAGLRIVEIHEEQVHFTPTDLGSAWAVHERMYTEQLDVLSHDARAALEHRFRSELSETVGVDRADVLYCVAQNRIAIRDEVGPDVH